MLLYKENIVHNKWLLGYSYEEFEDHQQNTKSCTHFFLDPPVCLGENLKQQSERRSENQQHDKEEDESS